MSRRVFDIETNGFLDKLTTIHCIATHDLDAPKTELFHGMTREIALDELADADEIIGHNIIDFDIPAVQKVFPEWKPRGKVIDTLVISRLIYPNLRDRDFAKHKKLGDKFTLPIHLFGSHGLEAWGHRLGFHKGDYMKEMKEKGLDPWAEYNDDMGSYCVNDVDLNVKLYEMFLKSGWSQRSMDIENELHVLCNLQMAHGCSFDEAAGQELYLKLSTEHRKIGEYLKGIYGCWYARDKEFTPKRDNKRMGYLEDTPLTKVKVIEFNPASRQHIGRCLMKLRGWKPSSYGNNGHPTIDESTISDLKYPEIPKLQRYLMLDKRIGQIAEGKNAWLKLVKPDGRIYGRVKPNAAITGRATHSNPNLGQVPAVRSPFGVDCRALFRATPGMDFIGADASGLELRLFAHYLSHYDGGDYAKIVLDGDIHTANQIAAGLPTRDAAKTFIYALLYGAGDFTLGGGNRAKGRRLRQQFMQSLPAYARLVKGVQKAAKKRGRLRALDGRYLWVRSEHAALNTLLQGAGAIIMKQSMINYHHILWDQNVPFHQVLFVHDEFQAESPGEYAETVGTAMVEGMRMTTQQFDLGCPIDGEFKVGVNWAETH